LSKARVKSLNAYFKEQGIQEDTQMEFRYENAWRIIQAVGSIGIRNQALNAPKLDQDIAALRTSTDVVYLYKTDFDRSAKSPRIQILFAEDNLVKNPGDFWQDINTTGGVGQEGGVLFPNGKKPEALLRRIIEMSTEQGDIVLDYHAGSGTTAAVAHKMGRRWVTIEQMDYIQDLTCQRLLNVLNGDQGGVSRAVGWPATGGGSFIYAELAEDTMTHLKQLEQATTQAEMDTLRHNLLHHRAIRLDLNTDAWLRDPAYTFKQGQADLYFNELPLHQQKHLLRQVINKNKLYVLADNVDDEAYAHLLTPEDKAFTHSFYQHAPLEQQEAVAHD
jgi:adenine-specific DNA-methyltransferase